MLCEFITRHNKLVIAITIISLYTHCHILQTAESRGMDPQSFCDEVSTSFRELLGLMEISNDRFIRTTENDHKEAVRHFWNVLVDNGAIYLGSYEGWYSVRDECYYNESELVDGKAPTGAEVVWLKKEDSYFFKLKAGL